MKRILIIGISGTGKSTLARQLGDALKLPVTHVDSLIWGEDWVEREEAETAQSLDKVLDQDRWIIEGWIEPLSKRRLEQADHVLFLDYSGVRAFVGCLKRWWQYRGKVRPEMSQGNVERFDWQYLMVALHRDERQQIEEAIVGFERKTIRFLSPHETGQYLRSLL